MPQLDFTTFSPQLVWLVITFGFLYFIMARSALPRVGEILEERQNRIDSDLETAENLKEQSKSLEEEYEQLFAKAKAEALSHLKAEREHIQKTMASRKVEMTATVEAKVAEAEERIQKAKEGVFKDLEGIAIEACGEIVTQLLSAKVNSAQVKAAVKASLP